jgi:hypothetical protein
MKSTNKALKTHGEKFKAADTDIKAAKTDITDLKAAVASFMPEVDQKLATREITLKAQMSATEAKASEAHDATNALNEKTNAHAQRLSGLEAGAHRTAADVKAVRDDFEQHVGTVGDRLVEHDEKFDAMQKDVTKALDGVEATNTKVAALEEGLKSANAFDHSVVQGEVQTLTNRVEAVEKQHTKELAALKQENTLKAAELTGLHEGYGKLDGRVTELETVRTELVTTRADVAEFMKSAAELNKKTSDVVKQTVTEHAQVAARRFEGTDKAIDVLNGAANTHGTQLAAHDTRITAVETQGGANHAALVDLGRAHAQRFTEVKREFTDANAALRAQFDTANASLLEADTKLRTDLAAVTKRTSKAERDINNRVTTADFNRDLDNRVRLTVAQQDAIVAILAALAAVQSHATQYTSLQSTASGYLVYECLLKYIIKNLPLVPASAKEWVVSAVRQSLLAAVNNSLIKDADLSKYNIRSHDNGWKVAAAYLAVHTASNLAWYGGKYAWKGGKYAVNWVRSSKKPAVRGGRKVTVEAPKVEVIPAPAVPSIDENPSYWTQAKKMACAYLSWQIKASLALVLLRMIDTAQP